MYIEQPAYQLTAEQIKRLIVLSRLVDIAPGPGGSRITPLSEAFVPEVTMIVQIGSVERAAVVALYPSSQIVAHADPPLRSTWNVRPLTRYHAPLVVDDNCWVFHAGTWQQLEVGKVYEMDPTQIHGAVNWGPAVRTHLIVDVL